MVQKASSGETLLPALLLDGSADAANNAANSAAAIAGQINVAVNQAIALRNALVSADAAIGAIGLDVERKIATIKARNVALQNGQNEAIAGEVALLKQKVSEQTSSLVKGGASLDQAVKQTAAVRAQVDEYSGLLNQNDALQESLKKTGAAGSKAGGSTAKALKAATKEAEALADEIQRLEFDADPMAKYNAELARLDQLLGSGLSPKAYEKAVADLNRELSGTSPLLNGITDGLESVIDFALGGFKDGFKGLVNIVTSTLKSIAAAFLKQKFIVPITASFGAVGAVGAAGQVAGAPGGGGIIGGLLGKSLGGLLGSWGGTGGILGGLSGVVSGFGSGGIGGALSSIGSSLSGAFSGGIAGIGSAIGAVIPVLGIAAAAFSFFRKKVTELDAGMRVSVEGMDALIQGFSTIETKKFWGLSKKVSTNLTDLDAAVAGPMEKAVNDILSGIVGTAGALGVASSAFDDFTTEINVSTKGMSDSEAQAAVMDALNILSDQFAGMVGGLKELQVEGEGFATTLTRLLTDLNAVNEMLYLFDRAALDMSLAGADAASKLIQLSGGLDAFSAKTQFVFENMLTERGQNARLTEIAMDSLNATFGDLKFAIPATHAEFMALARRARPDDGAGAADLRGIAGRGDRPLCRSTGRRSRPQTPWMQRRRSLQTPSS